MKLHKIAEATISSCSGQRKCRTGFPQKRDTRWSWVNHLSAPSPLVDQRQGREPQGMRVGGAASEWLEFGDRTQEKERVQCKSSRNCPRSLHVCGQRQRDAVGRGVEGWLGLGKGSSGKLSAVGDAAGREKVPHTGPGALGHHPGQGAALASRSLYPKVPPIGWLQQPSFVSHGSGRWKSELRCQHGPVLVGAFGSCPHTAPSLVRASREGTLPSHPLDLI